MEGMIIRIEKGIKERYKCKKQGENLNNYNPGEVIDMRKKQKISSPIIKIEEQQLESDFLSSRQDGKKRSRDQSHDQAERKPENTLSLLTKNFITLIKSRQNMTIDSNDAARELGIQKRRIYDITNVLQGIGYVEKVHKNKLRWVGGAKDPKIGCQIDNLDSQIESFERKQFELASKIQYLEKRIKNDFIQNRQLNFLRLSYFREVMQNLSSRPEMVVVVKAPKDTILTSSKNEETGENEVEIHFSKESKGSVFYVTRNPQVKVKQEKKIKMEETEKKIKREED